LHDYRWLINIYPAVCTVGYRDPGNGSFVPVDADLRPMPTVYVTAPKSTADELAATLVDERLAACVNAVDCQSTYRWEGEVTTDDETILLIKTTDEGYDRLAARIEELHPYEVPCIERFDETDMVDRFGVWIGESVD